MCRAQKVRLAITDRGSGAVTLGLLMLQCRTCACNATFMMTLYRACTSAFTVLCAYEHEGRFSFLW